MYKKNWIDKLITHNRDVVGDFGSRAVLHIPVGFLIGLLFPLSFPLLITFLVYEYLEDWRTSDHAWKDLFGALVGITLGMITLIIGGLILWL